MLALCDGSHALAEVISPILAAIVELSSVPIISIVCTIIRSCFTVRQIRRWLQLLDGHECDVGISQSMFMEQSYGYRVSALLGARTRNMLFDETTQESQSRLQCL